MSDLEQQLHRELNLAAGTIRAENLPEGRGLNVSSWIAVIRVVEDIEKFCSKLKSRALRKREILERIEIDILVGRADQIISALVAECILGGYRECGLINPLFVALGESRDRVWIAYLLCSLGSATHIRNVSACGGIEGCPGDKTDNGAHVPVAGNCLYHSIRV